MNVAFIGPDGTVDSYYSELMNNSPDLPVFDLTANPAALTDRYFQWRAYFESDDAAYSPELIDVTVEAAR